MDQNYQTTNNSLINIFKVFQQLIISKILKTIINISKIKIYKNTIFINFFNKNALANKIKKA